jgi:hypothetical protein
VRVTISGIWSFGGCQRSSLGPEEVVRLDVGIVVVLLEGGEPGSAVVLRTAAALFIAEMLASVWGEETWGEVRSAECDNVMLCENTLYSPTCSAFSQLRFILDWLSGSGNGSSWPDRSGLGPLEV